MEKKQVRVFLGEESGQLRRDDAGAAGSEGKLSVNEDRLGKTRVQGNVGQRPNAMAQKRLIERHPEDRS